MQYKEAEIAQTVYFWFAANGTDGAAGDGATPLYDVRLAGAAANAAPTASGTPTLLSHANYSDGLHEIAIDTTGYAAGEYAVFCTLTISTVNPAGFCGSFRLKAAGASIHSVTADWVNGGRLDLLLDAIKAIMDQFVFTVANKVDSNAILVAGAAPDDSADIAAEVLSEMNATPPKVDLIDAPNTTALAAIVAAINGLATYGLTALNTLLTSTGIKTATTAAPTDMATATNQTIILNRIGAFTGTGINTILGFFKALMGKGASNPTDLGALTFDAATDSVEGIRDTAPLGTAMRGTDNAMLATAKSTVGGYDTGQDPATLLLVTPANKINTDASNAVKIQKMAVSLAAADVSGNIASDLKAWNGGALPSIGTSTLTAQQVWEYATRTLSAFGFTVDATVADKTGYSLTVTPPTAQNIWEYATRTLTAFGFGVTVTTNNDKTGYTLTVTPPTSAEVADKVLGRNIAGGSDGGRTVKDALRTMRNKVEINVNTGAITVYAEDDMTPAWTGSVTTNALALPITSVDPT
jgi:hypothetical protein